MIELGKLALDLIVNLVASVIHEEVDYQALPFFERRRIERRIEDAIAEVVEPLLPFLSQERIPEDKQRRLIETCVDELRPLTQDPARLFQGSLDGQKIFDELYFSRELPQVVIEDGLKEIYALLCPRIATLLCKIPAAVKGWETEAWSENYRRLDELTSQLRDLFSVVDELATSPSIQSDQTLSVVRRAVAQRIRFELDLTGLRADRPLAGKFDDFFVHPEIIRSEEEGKRSRTAVETPEASLTLFTRHFSQVTVIGPAGSGKSTWAKWLQRETLTPKRTGLGIRIELRRFSSEELPTLHDLVRETAGRHLAEDLTAERIGHWLDAKRLIFILDGFDEIRPKDRGNVFDWIVELRSAARGCPFILTSRPLTTDHLNRLDASWKRWSIEPFNEHRIVEYIQRWYQYTPLLAASNRIVDAEQLAARWRQDPTIRPLTSNPLLLSTLLMVHHLDGSLPGGRSQLYRRYIEGMLGLWDDRRNVTATTVQLSLELKRQIIRGFALKLFFEEQEQLDETTTLEWLNGFLVRNNISISAVEILAQLRERSGLIVGPGIYSFAHKSIAEFQVAEAVLQGDQRDAAGTRIDRFRLFEHRDDDRWNTVIFLWAGLSPVIDIEDLVEECIEAGSWPLAYGIVLDQYDRFPLETRRGFLIRAIVSDEFPASMGIRSWAVSHPANEPSPSLAIPTFELRGLLPYLYFDSLVERASADGALAWSDYFDAGQQQKDLLWMYFALRPNDIEVWKDCLATPCPASTSSRTWLYWVAERNFRSALTHEELKLDTIVAAYRSAAPQAQGLIPIALASGWITLFELPDRTTKHLARESTTRFLEVFPDCDDGKISDDLLLGTRNWADFFLDSVGDLLTAVIARLDELVDQGLVERTEQYELAADFVHELRIKRDSLDNA